MLNEFNELQTYKLISTEFNLLLFALITEGLGLKEWVTYDPDLTTEYTNSPHNYALFFFLTAMITFSTGLVQYMLRQASKKHPLPTVEFVDLCTVCNISVLMFNESFHGYYLHGKSPYGMSEISSE